MISTQSTLATVNKSALLVSKETLNWLVLLVSVDGPVDSHVPAVPFLEPLLVPREYVPRVVFDAFSLTVSNGVVAEEAIKRYR